MTANIRIASLNTLHQGLSDPAREEQFKRLLAASGADMFCFQEEWRKDKFYDAARRLIPTEGSEEVNVHWWPGGCGIATTLPLEPVEFGLSRRTAAAVKVGTGYLVVVSAHLKCCGYAGSDEDRTARGPSP